MDRVSEKVRAVACLLIVSGPILLTFMLGLAAFTCQAVANWIDGACHKLTRRIMFGKWNRQ